MRRASILQVLRNPGLRTCAGRGFCFLPQPVGLDACAPASHLHDAFARFF